MKKITFHITSFLKNEWRVGTIEILLFILAGITALIWLEYNRPELEPYTILLACIGGVLDVLKRIVKAPKLPRLTFSEVNLKTTKESSFFIGATLTDLENALKIAKNGSKGLFIIFYDKENPTNSKLNYSLGYFTQYDITKRLINEYFIQVIVPSDSPGSENFIPSGYHMENCLLVVTNNKGEILRQEGVYANPDEGLRQVREDIQKLNTKLVGKK